MGKMKKRLVLCFGVLIIALSIWLGPFVSARVALSSLKIENVSKIIYVQYEDIPLSSKVKSKKCITAVNNQKQIKNFVNMFQDGNIQLKHIDKKTSNMLFLYFEDDRVVNAYVENNCLGFKYGKYWVKLKDIDGFISSMERVDYVEIKELSY